MNFDDQDEQDLIQLSNLHFTTCDFENGKSQARRSSQFVETILPILFINVNPVTAFTWHASSVFEALMSIDAELIIWFV